MLLKTRKVMNAFLRLFSGPDELLTIPALSDFKILVVWIFHSVY